MPVKGAQYRAGRGMGGQIVRLHGDMRPAIVAGAGSGKRAQGLQRVVAMQQWAAANRPDAREQRFRFGAKPDNDAACQ